MDRPKPLRWFGRLENLLSVFLALGLVAGIIGLAGTVAMVFAHPSAGIEVILPHAHAAGARVEPGAQLLDGPITATVAADHGSAGFAGLYLLTWLPGAATLLLALWGLVRVLRRGRFGDRSLFSPETLAGLKRVAKVLIFGSLLAAVLSTVAKSVLAGMLVDAFVISWPTSSPVIGILTGLGLLAVAEIIRRGLDLMAELEGTV